VGDFGFRFAKLPFESRKGRRNKVCEDANLISHIRILWIEEKLSKRFFILKNIYTIHSMNSLFSQNITPLASLLRPEKLDDLVGQQHLIGE